MVEYKHPTNPNQEEQENEQAEILIETIMEEGSTELSLSPLTPTRPINSPNKEDESPFKKAKTETSKELSTDQAETETKQHRPYDKSKTYKSNNNNFGKVASSRVSAGRKKKKPTTHKTYLRVQLPKQVKNCQQWSQVTVETIKLIHEVWKSLCEVDSKNSTIEP